MQNILENLTSKKLLQQSEFDKPLIISPGEFSSFEKLYDRRHMIRDLKLVPIKDDSMYQFYKTFDRSILAQNILDQFKLQQTNILILPNQFPDWLPLDVNQRVVWVKDRTSTEKVLRYILLLLKKEKEEKYILFERPRKNNTLLIKGSIPTVRHIHLWTKLDIDYKEEYLTKLTKMSNEELLKEHALACVGNDNVFVKNWKLDTIKKFIKT